MPASTTETDADGPCSGHPLPSASLLVRGSLASHHGCVLLNRTGAWLEEGFPVDRATSAMSRTSRGDEISVSFVLVEPPDTSFLTAHLAPAASWSTPTIIAAHRDVVLLMIMSSYENTNRADIVVDLFVYQASRRMPSLLLLPSANGPAIHPYLRVTGTECLRIMSCTSDDDDDSSPAFVVAYLEMTRSAGAATMGARLFLSVSGQWEVFNNLPVHDANANSGLAMGWLQTMDEVLQYGPRCMIWVDYYYGMVIMDLSSRLETATTNPPPPGLRYVPLPVHTAKCPGDPGEHPELGGRGCPRESRSLCVTRHGIKFVSVDRQYWSNFGIGNRDTLTWSHRFRITTWSLLEDGYTWTNDTWMHEKKFWDAFNGSEYRLSYARVEPQFPIINVVEPQFPIISVDNPDVVVFQLMEPRAYGPKWIIEVDFRKKVLLGVIDCSKKEVMPYENLILIPSRELPRGWSFNRKN